jgi:hypothetical protein
MNHVNSNFIIAPGVAVIAAKVPRAMRATQRDLNQAG